MKTNAKEIGCMEVAKNCNAEGGTLKQSVKGYENKRSVCLSREVP